MLKKHKLVQIKTIKPVFASPINAIGIDYILPS